MAPTFRELGVPHGICNSLEQRGITEPFEIQAATLTDALAGRDICGRAPTGSGKTIAFGVPLVSRVDRAQPGRPTALVLAPTRELADQIANELRTFANGARIAVVYGGVGYGRQLKALDKGVDILVACPGRLEDLIQQGAVELGAAELVVIDEADRMADMGFLPAVKRLLDQTAAERQTLLFSATLDGDIAQLTKRYQVDPVRHEVGESTPDVTQADHHFWTIERTDRVPATAGAVRSIWPAIVFCRTRHGCDRLTKQLGRLGIDAVPIHGGRSQNQRTRALDAFTKGDAQALIATDVAARGIHVDGVRLVVHFDLPEDHKAFVHRSGRTARAGSTGTVLTLVQPAQKKDARSIQRKVGIDVELVPHGDDIALPIDPDQPERKPARPAQRGPGGDKGRTQNTSKGSSGGGNRNKKKRSKGPASKSKPKSKHKPKKGSGKQSTPRTSAGKGSAKPKKKGSGKQSTPRTSAGKGSAKPKSKRKPKNRKHRTAGASGRRRSSGGARTR